MFVYNDFEDTFYCCDFSYTDYSSLCYVFEDYQGRCLDHSEGDYGACVTGCTLGWLNQIFLCIPLVILECILLPKTTSFGGFVVPNQPNQAVIVQAPMVA